MSIKEGESHFTQLSLSISLCPASIFGHTSRPQFSPSISVYKEKLGQLHIGYFYNCSRFVEFCLHAYNQLMETCNKYIYF